MSSTPYDRQTSFALYSAENPGEPHSGATLDAEFNAVKLSLDDTQQNLALIQDDDGAVKRGSIGKEQFDSSVSIGFGAPSQWATGQIYTAEVDTVFYQSKFYIAKVTHTSGVSFAPANWTEIADFTLAAVIADGSITSAKLATGAVTADKIGAGSITNVKLGTGAVETVKILDANVTTPKIADDAVTLDKLLNATGAVLLGKPNSGIGNFSEITLGANMAFSGSTLTSSFDAVNIPRYLAGLELSTAGSSATFSVTSGAAVDGTSLMVLSSAISKTTGAWTVGSGNGSLDTGTIANSTWYHVWLIKRPDTGVVDVLTSLSASAPTMPTNYTLKRRIGSMKTNGSAQWIKFYQIGDEFLWDVPVNDYSAVATPAGLLALASIPTGVSVLARMNLLLASTTAGANVLLHSPLTGNQTQGSPSGNVTIWTQVITLNIGGQASIMTDTSAQIRASSNGAGTITFVITTHGWNDRRGK